MIMVSLCMIVKNEEAVLARCLESVKHLVDEIIIADTGSGDKTKEIAAKYTDKIYDFRWIDDFGAARNFSFSKATMDYELWLDADDVIEEEEAVKFTELKKNLSPDIDMVTMLYDTGFDVDGKALLTSTRERLIKRDRGFYWIDPVHECIPLAGNVYYSDIRISHRKEKTTEISKRNLEIYEKLKVRGACFTPRQTYYYARELFDHKEYSEAAKYFELFLLENKGWKEDNISACILLAKCYNFLCEKEKVPENLVRSFVYDAPVPEICCQLGYYYKEKMDFETAIGWFETALVPRRSRRGFVQQKYEGYIPHIELCVCYFKLGDMEKAIYHNNKAAELNEKDQAVIHNLEFFAKFNGNI